MKYVYTLRFIVLIAVATQAYGQTEGTMPFMKTLPQVTSYNPAFKPAYNLTIGLPVMSSIFVQYTNNGFSYNDIVSKQGSLRVADLAKISAALKDKNHINANLQTDLFRFGLRVTPQLYVSLNATVKGYNRFTIPKDIVAVFANGTEPYINKTAQFSPEVQAMEYIETGIGAAYSVDEKLTVGARVKILKGAVNVNSERASFGLSVADSYAMTIKGDADIRTSGIHAFDDSNFDIADDWGNYLKNTGVALDLGATYQLTDKITVGASLVDLGGITWKNDTYGYKMDPTKATYTFEGVDIQKVLDGDNSYFESLADSVEKKLDFTEGKIGKYKTALPRKMYLTGSYKIQKSLTVNGLFFVEQFKGRTMPALTASLNKEFGKFFSAAVSYTVSNRSLNNLGAGLSLNLVPFQLYIVSDDLLRASIAMARKDGNSYVNNTQYFNMRLGLNLIFGRTKTDDERPATKNATKKRKKK